MKELWSKYSKRVMAVIAAALVALLAIFNEAVTDLLSGNEEEAPVEEVVEDTPAEVVEEVPVEEVTE